MIESGKSLLKEVTKTIKLNKGPQETIESVLNLYWNFTTKMRGSIQKDLNRNTVKEIYLVDWGFKMGQYPKWLQYLADPLCSMFNCRSQIKICEDDKRAYIMAYGYDLDLKVAFKLFEYLIDDIQKIQRKAKKKYQISHLSKKELKSIELEIISGDIADLVGTKKSKFLKLEKLKLIKDKFGPMKEEKGSTQLLADYKTRKIYPKEVIKNEEKKLKQERANISKGMIELKIENPLKRIRTSLMKIYNKPLTQYEAAKRLGVSPHTYMMYERTTKPAPIPEYIVRSIELGALSITGLLDGDGNVIRSQLQLKIDEWNRQHKEQP